MIVKIFLIILLSALSIAASDKTSTSFSAAAIIENNKIIFATVTRAKSQMPISKLYQSDFAGKKNPLDIPKAFMEREIISIFPAKDSLIIVTQNKVEQGDKPTVYSYVKKTKKWDELGEVDCVAPAKISFEKNDIIFSCLTSKDGKENYKSATIAHKIVGITEPFQNNGGESIPSAIKEVKAKFSEPYKGWQKIIVNNNTISAE